MRYYPGSTYKFLRVSEIVIVMLLLVFVTGHSNAQNTVSPYSVFGPGEIQDRGFGVSDGMGGAGIAIKSGNFLNNLNPASYAGIDSSRIISEFGIAGKAYKMSSSSESQLGFTGNLSYIGLGFRYTSWLAGSFGIVPFSTINYSILKTNYVEGTDAMYNSTYVGSGGISQFYFGNAVRLFNRHLSLGVNVSYMFGALIQEENIEATNLVPQLQVVRNDHLRSLYFDCGLQYSVNINNNEFSLGATFAPEQNLKSKHILTVYDDSYSELYSDEYDTDYLTVPDIAGVGLALVKQGRYKLALDYNYQNWSAVEYPTQNDDFVDLHKMAFGMELHPWRYSAVNAAYKNWAYRFGFNYTRSYLKLGGSPIGRRSFTMGVGIPLPGHISNVNFSVSGGWTGTTSNNLVEERFILFNLGLNLNEMAFMRRTFD